MEVSDIHDLIINSFGVYRMFATLVLGLFLIQPLFAATQKDAAARLASAGWQAYEEARFADAKVSMEQAARLNPAQPDYQAALAAIDVKLGDQDAAIEHFQKAIRMKPSDPEVRLQLAQVYQSKNKDSEALQVLQVAHPEGGLSAAWHFSRGFSLFRIGRFAAARNEFELLVRDPQFQAPADFFLGNIAYTQARFEEAAPYLAAAVQLGNSESNKAYNAYTYDYGLVLFKLGRFAEAAQQFKASLERYAQDPLPWMFLGRCEQELGNYQAAIDMLETSIKVDPEFQLSYYELARLQQKHGDPLRAEELFAKIGQKKKEEISQEEDRAMKLRTGIER
jgi:tetratricopeptide (TPR) repeat protein